ncbi:MAG: DNA-3-methyladenine glycosylase 2 family protein [Coriobacteriia bacterium]
MTRVSYGPGGDAVEHLIANDERLAGLIEQIGVTSFELREDRFAALARAIVGQQLSVKAARTIWSRVEAAVGTVTAGGVAAADRDALRSAGLSAAKLTYVTDLATRVADGSVDLDALDDLSDEEAIGRLTTIKGVGRWTSEMFLIFSLGRPDVFALDDAGLRRSIGLLYGPRVLDDAQALAVITDRWRPYRSVASLYLWDALD